MIEPAHDRQIVQIRMSGGTLLIGPAQYPDIVFWQKALAQGQLHPLAGHGLRQAERTSHAGPELRLLLDRIGVSMRSMSDREAGHAIQRAIGDRRLSAVFIPAVKARPPASSELAGKLVPAPAHASPAVKPRLSAGPVVKAPLGAVPSPGNQRPTFDFARASRPERMIEMLRRTPKHLEGQLKQTVDQMLSSDSVAMLGASLAAVAAAHLVGAGEAVDAVLAGFAFVTAGWSGLVALKDIVVATVKAATATRDAELDGAAEQFSGGLMVLGEAFLAFLLARGIRQIAGKFSEESASLKRETGQRFRKDANNQSPPKNGEIQTSGIAKIAAVKAASLREISPPAARKSLLGMPYQERLDALNAMVEDTRMLDVHTSRDAAAVYSGKLFTRSEGISAREFAQIHGKTVLETTPGGKFLEEISIYDKVLEREDADMVWTKLSGRYAAGITGEVAVFKGEMRPNAVLYHELGILNKKVSTGSVTSIKNYDINDMLDKLGH